MCSLLLKKALPFALTFILGSLVGGLFRTASNVSTRVTYEWQTFDPMSDDGSHGHRHSCRMDMRGRYLVAESKPLRITFKPDARWPRGLEAEKSAFDPVRVTVTFGADGKVSYATAEGSCFSDSAVSRLKPIRDAAEYAARQIQFEPEIENGLPVTVTREVEIRFMDE